MHLNSSRNPLQSAGTLLCSQQEPYKVSRNPLWLAGTLGGQQEPLVIAETMHGNSNLFT